MKDPILGGSGGLSKWVSNEDHWGYHLADMGVVCMFTKSPSPFK